MFRQVLEMASFGAFEKCSLFFFFKQPFLTTETGSLFPHMHRGADTVHCSHGPNCSFAGLSSFQESVAMDRIQRIMGVLQNPCLG